MCPLLDGWVCMCPHCWVAEYVCVHFCPAWVCMDLLWLVGPLGVYASVFGQLGMYVFVVGHLGVK